MAEMPLPLCVEEQTRHNTPLPHLDHNLRTEAGFQMFEHSVNDRTVGPPDMML